MFRTLAAAALMLAAAGAAAEPIRSSVDSATLSDSRRTTLGLYVTSGDAAKALEADPGIVFIDVRTTAEFVFVGHPAPVDANIPLRFHTRAHDPDRKGYGMVDNPAFLDEVEATMARLGKGKDDPVFLICRSGSRSRAAVDMLANAGFTNVWNVVDGFEGGKDKATGHRTVEGWRNAGLPWTYSAPADVARSW